MGLTNFATNQSLAREAIAGSQDAADKLARDAPQDGFMPFLAKFVKPELMTAEVWRRFDRAYSKMEDARRDRVLADLEAIETKET